MLPDPLPRPTEDVVFRRMEDEVVLVNLPTNRIYSLNRTAARLWGLLSEGLDGPEIIEQLTTEFGVDAAAAESEVARMLEQLIAERLVR